MSADGAEISPTTASRPAAVDNAARVVEPPARPARPPAPSPPESAGQDRRGGHAPADQPLAKPFRPREPALQRPEGPAQLPRRLLPRQALQEAEHDRCAVPPRQPVDLLVDERAEVVGTRVAGRWIGHLGGPPLVPPPPGRGRPGAPGDPAGDLMQPGGQGVLHPQRAGLAPGRGMRPGRRPPPRARRAGSIGRAQDDRPVPLDQGREGARRLPAPGAEVFQQLPGRQPDGRPRPEQHLDVPEDAAKSALRHQLVPFAGRRIFTTIMSRRGRIGPTIRKNAKESTRSTVSTIAGP